MVLAAIIINLILAASVILKFRGNSPHPVLHTVASVISAEASFSILALSVAGAPAFTLAIGSSVALVFAVIPAADYLFSRLPSRRKAPIEDDADFPEMSAALDEVLYERCCAYMENKKPFLVEALTLGDLAAALFTNTLYLSRTINSCSGKNFRRFVNDYRVDYAMKIFRKNTSLKVSELSEMSGFHTVVTFNMAFKLVKGVAPSVWCQSVRFGVEKSAKATTSRAASSRC